MKGKEILGNKLSVNVEQWILVTHIGNFGRDSDFTILGKGVLLFLSEKIKPFFAL